MAVDAADLPAASAKSTQDWMTRWPAPAPSSARRAGRAGSASRTGGWTSVSRELVGQSDGELADPLRPRGSRAERSATWTAVPTWSTSLRPSLPFVQPGPGAAAGGLRDSARRVWRLRRVRTRCPLRPASRGARGPLPPPGAGAAHDRIPHPGHGAGDDAQAAPALRPRGHQRRRGRLLRGVARQTLWAARQAGLPVAGGPESETGSEPALPARDEDCKARMSPAELSARFRERAADEQFDLVGVAASARLDRDAKALETWLAGGLHASMLWMAREPDEARRSGRPAARLPQRHRAGDELLAGSVRNRSGRPCREA